MVKSLSLSDAIRSSVPPVVRRGLRWFEEIDAEILAELEAIRADHISGRLAGSRTAVAKAIVGELHARGLSDIGIQGVNTWLRDG